MVPELKLKVQHILLIIGMGMLFGLLYNFLYYPHTFTEYAEAGSISILIGLMVGILEEFAFKKLFQHIRFLFVLLIRTLIYSLLTSVILSFVLSFETASVENINYLDAVKEYLGGPLFERDFLFSFSFILLMLFITEVILLIGKANFLRLTLGLYHQPHEISRIFMFLDLKGSTTIAEKLSNKSFSAFIRDYFFDISDAIMMYKGEIYQYAGDGIIVVWPLGSNNDNCIRTFFKMVEIIEKKRTIYLQKYGVIPQFKAGIHTGQVIVTSVGKLKKEIVYHGDVLNTTSRIEGKCNELNQDLLISEHMLSCIRLTNDLVVEEKGEIELKGKTNKLRLYGITLASPHSEAIAFPEPKRVGMV
jgi:adenylate cyclase